ncbi:MAG: hypothetical protein KatS3mg102_0034 [Planctomycetota bacterium]|nr:MAG: hypothetical protein KatS3mg102_0034 [Planctomycetota bacterium]
MADTRRDRGPHPADRELFGPAALPRLREAVAHLGWLLERGYALPSSLKLVGDRFALVARQRTALMRCACAPSAARARRARAVPPAELGGQVLLLDGYNVLTAVEAALAGGVLLLGADGCVRDMASMHGTWRRVRQTDPALERIAASAAELGLAGLRWYLDRPVSNSGRLAARIAALAQERGWPWEVRLVQSADAVLARAAETVATTDSAVLDRCGRWFDLAGHVVRTQLPQAWVVDLRAGPPPAAP